MSRVKPIILSQTAFLLDYPISMLEPPPWVKTPVPNYMAQILGNFHPINDPGQNSLLVNKMIFSFELPNAVSQLKLILHKNEFKVFLARALFIMDSRNLFPHYKISIFTLAQDQAVAMAYFRFAQTSEHFSADVFLWQTLGRWRHTQIIGSSIKASIFALIFKPHEALGNGLEENSACFMLNLFWRW